MGQTRTKAGIRMVFLAAGMLFLTACSSTSTAFTAFLPETSDHKSKSQRPILFYVAEGDKLYASELSEVQRRPGHELDALMLPNQEDSYRLIDEREGISDQGYPLAVSPAGKHIAYTAGNSLYMSKADFASSAPAEPVCVIDGEQSGNTYMSYAWADDERLVYTTGEWLGWCDSSGKGSAASDGYYYENLVSDGNGLIYAARYDMSPDSPADSAEVSNQEIVCFHAAEISPKSDEKYAQASQDAVEDEPRRRLEPGERKVWVLLSTESQTQGLLTNNLQGGGFSEDVFQDTYTEDVLQDTYTIAGISPDNSKLFVWLHARSGSMSADGAGTLLICRLDGAARAASGVTERLASVSKFQISSLMYPDHIAPNPADSSLVALNTGSGRDMWINKQIQILDIENKTLKRITFGGEATMTPVWSLDGKMLIYAKGKENTEHWQFIEQNKDDHETIARHQKELMQRNLYGLDMSRPETQAEAEPMISGDLCDFAPVCLDNAEDIVFARWDETTESLSLHRQIKNGDEWISSVLAEHVKSPYEAGNAAYYGHMDVSPLFTVWKPAETV